jgi:hypothetical protein
VLPFSSVVDQILTHHNVYVCCCSSCDLNWKLSFQFRFAAHSSSDGSVEKIDFDKAARKPLSPFIPTLLFTISLVAIGALPLADFDDPNINKDEAITGVLG